MKDVRAILWLLPLLALSGCKSLSAKSCHAPQPYQEAKSAPPLKIPAGLDSPETANTLRIPQLSEPPPPPRKGKDPCLDEPPPFKVRPAAQTPHA